jgi:hypothetical protein
MGSLMKMSRLWDQLVAKAQDDVTSFVTESNELYTDMCLFVETYDV